VSAGLRESLLAGASESAAAPRAGRSALVLAGLAVAVVLCALVCPLIGATRLNFAAVFGIGIDASAPNVDRHIFMTTRLPRVLFGLVAGAALGLAGVVYQAILRNDLAEPFTLGVAGGATVGALLAFHLAPMLWAPSLMPFSALLFAMLAVVVIYGLARRRGPLSSPATLILAGVTLNFLFGSVILLIQYLSNPYQTMLMLRWLMGGLDTGSLRVAGGCAAIVVATAVVLFGMARRLNLLAVGDQAAHHLGVPVESTRLICLGAASAMAAVIVAYAGPIGFVGLIVPHILRRLIGADHRLLLPAAALGGAAFLALCDTAARALPGGAEIPVGIVTAFLGAPFFLWLLFRR